MQDRPTLSRRSFLQAGAGLMCTSLLSRSLTTAQTLDIDPFIESLFAESLVFDGIVNLGVNRGSGRVSLLPGHIKRLTGINVGNHTTGTAALDSRNRLVSENQQALLRVDRFADLEHARQTDRYGIIYYVQSGIRMDGSLEPLARWKEQGLRTFQLTFEDNELGGGSDSNGTRLSPFGRKVVAELNRLHMVVDVSHSGRRTTLDAVDASSYPVTANHANAERLTPHPRNKSDEELRAIAASGGVVGVTNINRFALRDARRPGTIDDIVAHLQYLVETIGIDHVGVASDSNMDGSHRYEIDYLDPAMSGLSRWKLVAGQLHRRGYSKLDLQKILGLNFLRVYRQILDP